MNILIPFLQQYGAITGAVTAIALVVVGGIALWIDFRSDRRQQHNFSVENRRLSEVNLEIGHELNLIPDITQRTILEDVIKADMRAYMTFQLPLVNIGDGPVDILAALTSSRQLPGDPTSGIGTRSRDVEWSDYLSFHWNHGKPGALFCGISTTKNGSWPLYVKRLSGSGKGRAMLRAQHSQLRVPSAARWFLLTHA